MGKNQGKLSVHQNKEQNMLAVILSLLSVQAVNKAFAWIHKQA